MKKSALILLTATLLGACATTSKTQTQAPSTNDTRECAKNFTYDGSFLAGRTYKTNAFVKGVSKAEAMKRAARYTLSDGWQINNTDKELGMISASQTVSYGQGKTVPLNIGIESMNGGVKVSMTYSTSGGVTSPLESIKKHFCTTIAAVEGK